MAEGLIEPLVLAMNSGSSSLKFALFRFRGEGERRIADGAVEGIGLPAGHAWLRLDGDARPRERGSVYADHASAISAAFALLEEHHLALPTAVGHRIVHGGPAHDTPEVVDAALLAALRRATRFAPLHLPAELSGIDAVAARFPHLPQVVCFDTGFHRGLPEVARRFPLPRRFEDQGLRRYGFHGLSYEYLVETLGAGPLGRAVLAHLGNGASMVAVKNGEPLDTTMGLTPTGGFMMGTRTGDLDPGLLIHLLGEGHDARSLEHLVNHEAGLLGVSGSTSDMKALLAQRADHADAALAVEMFCYQARKAIGALAAVLGGLDSLVFTGGIGERAAPVRGSICAGLEHLGIRIDPALNAVGAPVISADGGPCTVRVLVTDEERMIARHTWRTLLRASSWPSADRQSQAL
ncbi:MAG TPA: acetate/propionate family kinase [Candidatus Acidoferrum sp.]|nr:acetate/propionate family kinase [Candidatus Acidoferrum sp.]